MAGFLLSEKFRRYKGKQIDVLFNLELCIHSGSCVRGLQEVFDVQKRPWIQMDGAPEDQIMAQVAQCPSGAFRIERKTD